MKKKECFNKNKDLEYENDLFEKAIKNLKINLLEIKGDLSESELNLINDEMKRIEKEDLKNGLWLF